MIQLPHIKIRIRRLKELTQGLAKEVTKWKGRESPLLPAERRRHVNAMTSALAGLDAARAALAAAAGPHGRPGRNSSSRYAFAASPSRSRCIRSGSPKKAAPMPASTDRVVTRSSALPSSQIASE